ncbi:MAG TPA: DUF72 domain-containing protein [Streptosporangiaceae bacterium]|nr:DUF72 domain-containing protein [Streptosporangiaceae bacterium]
MPVLIGTSGWQYRSWRGVLYPPGVPQRRWLEYYAERFATVENNNAFYRLAPRETFEGWAVRTPPGFVMAVKASRFLTHIRRLRDPAEPVARMMAATAGLGGRLGPVLVQLPPTFAADPGRLEACLAEFRRAGASVPAGLRIAVEPRHGSWWSADVREILTRYGAALAWADRLGSPVGPLWRTAGWGYLRLHEGTAAPCPRYTAAALREWAARIAAAWPPEADVYVYFNNDPGGAAVRDAAAFADAVRQAGRTPARTPATP